MTPHSNHQLSRRRFMMSGFFFVGAPVVARVGYSLADRTVAGVEIPSTRLAQAAETLSRSACPVFLYNHCMRTYLFGALHARHHGQRFDHETAFVASALHDLGLLTAYETKDLPFEADSANTAEAFAKREGLSGADARRIWDAVVFHDMRWAVVSRQSTEAILVATGAAADVVGPDPEMFSATDIAAVVKAFPRLNFKGEFKHLLTSHCQRKPGSQDGTWLDNYCRRVDSGAADGGKTAAAIDAAPFDQ